MTSEKGKAPNGAATNGDHQTKEQTAESDDENYEIQEFDESEEAVVVIDDDDDDEEPSKADEEVKEECEDKVKSEDGDVEMKDIKVRQALCKLARGYV